MKEIISWENQKYELEWIEEFDKSLLNNLKQVYGFLFDAKGKMAVVTDDPERGWTLVGGGPEKEDADWRETIIREADEEVDVELDKDSLKILGMIKVRPVSTNCELGIHYLLRVIGKITKINSQTKDPCRDSINYREFIDPKSFLDYCPWGKIGKVQQKKALEVWENIK